MTQHIKLSCFIMIAFFAIIIKASAQQDNSLAFAAADTSRFSPNKNQGWKLFNSYVSSYKQDSATLELIIQHDNNIDWTKENPVGRIKPASLMPKTGQRLLFNLLTNIYMLRIDTYGECYLQFLTGSLPSKDPFILPLKVFYKL